MLDHDACYEAISAKDRRFDGQFFTGVTSTGIFCRPSCPARTPKRANTTFWPHAAAALEAGFRPCKRCRPELAPGHWEWSRSETLAAQALRLIEAGEIDRIGVTGLATRLAVSERHLRRELQATVGAGPLQLARARRVRVARLLLDQTTLPVTDVAFAAGFGSVRQFNDAMRATFGASPTALRRRPGGPVPDTRFTVELPARGRLDPAWFTDFSRSHAIPGIETVDDDGYHRRVPGGGVTLLATETGLRMTIGTEDLSTVADLVGRARRYADLDADLETIAADLRHDPLLADRLERHGLPRLPGGWDAFEVAVRAIVGQQVSVAGATTVVGRIVERAGGGEGGFPSPEAVADADLTGVGMITRRIITVQELARRLADGRLTLDAATDPDRAIAELVDLPGIGPWTAGYVTMRALPHPDGWPPGDLGLRRSAGLEAAELETRAERWRPWRAYAAVLLWATDPTEWRTRSPRTPRPTEETA